MTATEPVFPLPKGYFGDSIEQDDEHKNQYRTMIADQLHSILKEEYGFSPVRPGKSLDSQSRWQYVKKQRGFQLFKRINGRRRSLGLPSTQCVSSALDELFSESADNLHEQTARHSMSRTMEREAIPESNVLAVGRIQGSMEELIYGYYSSTHEELHLTLPFLTEHTLDATVLDTIDTPTAENPFNYLGLKWQFRKIRGLHARDFCYLDATGMTIDSHGNRYGYIALHSVDVENCLRFLPSTALRAKVFFTYIFRQTEQGMIDVFCQGSIQAQGELLEAWQFANGMTLALLTQQTAYVRCGAAKKLTVLAVRNYELVGSAQSKPTGCVRCNKKRGVFTSLKICKVCCLPICWKCRTKALIFAGKTRAIVKVTCCPTCVVRARNWDISPVDPQWALFAQDRWGNDSFVERSNITDSYEFEEDTKRYNSAYRDSTGELGQSVGPDNGNWLHSDLDILEDDERLGMTNFCASSSINSGRTTSTTDDEDDSLLSRLVNTIVKEHHSRSSWDSETEHDTVLALTLGRKVYRHQDLGEVNDNKPLKSSRSVSTRITHRRDMDERALFQQLAGMHARSAKSTNDETAWHKRVYSSIN